MSASGGSGAGEGDPLRPSRRCGSPAVATCLLGLTTAALLLTACGGTAAPPQPGDSRGVPPDLRGRSVMLLPVQHNLGIPGDPSAELTFALTERGDQVDWILEDEIQEILERSPGIDADTRGLPVGVFLQAEVDRIGDPLYGQLRRMASLVDADAVVLPVAASYEANPEVEGSTPRVRLTATIIEPRSGRVLWFGVEEGGDFDRTDPRALASAAERLARTIVWYGPS